MSNLESGKILVTGGAGFIGSALIAALNARGIDDIVVSDFLHNDEKWKNLVSLRFADYLEADELLRRVNESEKGGSSLAKLGKIKTVFHFGACSATTERDARHLIQNNYEYTKELATWSLANDARFVYASSAATYGDGEQGMSDSADLHSLRPLNMYGYSKQLFDQFANRERFLDRIVGLKFFNIFGPNENHKADMRSLVEKAYHQIVETGKIRLFKSEHPDYEDGEQKRDFLYVKDAVQMTLHLAVSENAGGLFNIGSGEANTWNRLATSIFAALGKAPAIEYIEMPDALKAKYQYFTQADISKLRATGYDSKIMPFAESVRDYVCNYLIPEKHLGDE